MNGPQVCEPKISTVCRFGLAKSTVVLPSGDLAETFGIAAPSAGALSWPRPARRRRSFWARAVALMARTRTSSEPVNVFMAETLTAPRWAASYVDPFGDAALLLPKDALEEHFHRLLSFSCKGNEKQIDSNIFKIKPKAG